MLLKTAQKLAELVFEHCETLHLPPLCVVILDAGGQTKLSVSQDGVSTLRHAIAHAKANAAIGMGMSTRQLYSLFESNVLPDRFAVTISGAANGAFIPQPGGELIEKDGEVVGAIGVSGATSNDDESVIRKALSQL